MYKYIMHHHSASGNNTTIEDITRWHKERGFRTIGYNYVIYPDGQILPGRKLGEVGAHCDAGNMNKLAIGICLIGNFTKFNPTVQQYESVVKLDKELMEKYNIPINNLIRHSDYKATACPGGYFNLNYIKDKIKGDGKVKIDYNYNEELKNAVLYLNQIGILNGYSSDEKGLPLTVKPKENLTNERFYIILYRALKYLKELS